MTPIFEFNEKLPNDLMKVNPFVDIIFQKLSPLVSDQKEAFKVKLVLEEAITNAMRHGNKMQPGRWVTVRVTADTKEFFVDIHDEGKGFDFNVVPNPTEGNRTDIAGGRGVFLMRQFMDKVDFYDGGSGVRMVKKF